MRKSNDQQSMVVEDSEKKGGKTFIDKVCDPCGLVPDNLEEALAHKKKMKELEAEREAAAAEDPIIQTSQEEKNTADGDGGDDGMLSNFGIDCCGKTPDTSDDVEVKEFPIEKNQENTDELMTKNEETISVMTGNNSQPTRSLADIAAKMDEIDLETAGEDTVGDQLADDETSIKKMRNEQEWYKEPLYAGLIIMCGAFGIAIFVMAILLIAHRN